MTPHMNDGYAGGRAMDRDQMTAASTAPTCLYNFNRFAKVCRRDIPFLLPILHPAKFFLSAGKNCGIRT